MVPGVWLLALMKKRAGLSLQLTATKPLWCRLKHGTMNAISLANIRFSLSCH